MNEPATWRVSIEQLLSIYRDGLNAVIPVAEAAKIPWRDGEAYDDWDAIADGLYKGIVSSSVRHSTQGRTIESFPNHDMLESSYAGMTFIRVRGPDIPESEIACFVGLVGDRSGSLVVKWVALGPGGEVIRGPERLPFDKLDFSLQLRLEGPEVRTLEVEL